MCVCCVFQTFEGNVNSEGVVRHELQHTILARYIRFIPVEWSREGRIGVRLDLYGCSYCEYKCTRGGNLIQPLCSALGTCPRSTQLPTHCKLGYTPAHVTQ